MVDGPTVVIDEWNNRELWCEIAVRRIMTTSATTTTSIWDHWLATRTSTATTNYTADVVWGTWTSESTFTIAGSTRRTHRTQQEIAAAQEREAQFMREQVARAAVERRIAAEAERKAEQLLLAFLSQEQRATYQQHKYVVIVGRSGRRYRVRRGRIGNVDVINAKGEIESRLCAHPNIWTPDHDVMVAQLLHLQHDEDGFCRSANTHPPFERGPVLPALVH